MGLFDVVSKENAVRLVRRSAQPSRTTSPARSSDAIAVQNSPIKTNAVPPLAPTKLVSVKRARSSHGQSIVSATPTITTTPILLVDDKSHQPTTSPSCTSTFNGNHTSSKCTALQKLTDAQSQVKQYIKEFLSHLELPIPRQNAVRLLIQAFGLPQIICAVHKHNTAIIEQIMETAIETCQLLEARIHDLCRSQADPTNPSSQLMWRFKGFLSKPAVTQWIKQRYCTNFAACLITYGTETRSILCNQDAKFLLHAYLDPHATLHKETSPVACRPLLSDNTSLLAPTASAESRLRTKLGKMTFVAESAKLFGDSKYNRMTEKRCPKCKKPAETGQRSLKRAMDEATTGVWRCNTCNIGGKL